MNRRIARYSLIIAAALASSAFAQTSMPSTAPASPMDAQALYARVTPSLVAVQFQFNGETISHELIGPGVVVSSDGLVMTPLAFFNTLLPDAQMKDFKIVVPSQDKDAEEIDATFVGRDERNDVAFVKANGKHDWKPLSFTPTPVHVGDPLYSIGLLPKSAAYKTYYLPTTVSAILRGEQKQILVSPGLTGAGSPVFNAAGEAVGMVTDGASILLNMDDPERDMQAILQPPKFYMPASEFMQSLNDPPVAGEPQKLPWLGVPNMRGLDKDTAEAFGLANQPAIEIGEVLPDSPAAKAGVTRGNILVKVNGQPLPRPDEPRELPGIVARMIRRMKVGDVVTLTVLPGQGQPTKDLQVTLGEMPMRPNRAKRFYAEDLGFVAREMVFNDTYRQHMPADSKGVVVALVRPSSSAETAKLQVGDVITQLNGQPVNDLPSFKTAYEAFRKDHPKDAVVLVVTRKFPSTESIRIEPPQ